MTLADAVYERAFLRLMQGKPLTKPQRNELDSRRLPGGAYPVPARMDPTVTP